ASLRSAAPPVDAQRRGIADARCRDPADAREELGASPATRRDPRGAPRLPSRSRRRDDAGARRPGAEPAAVHAFAPDAAAVHTPDDGARTVRRGTATERG